MPPAGFILQLTEWTQEQCIFVFKRHFINRSKAQQWVLVSLPTLQTFSLACGKRHSYIKNSWYILWWGRYIIYHNIFMIWSGPHIFHNVINGTKNNLKLSLDYSLTEIHSLICNQSKTLVVISTHLFSENQQTATPFLEPTSIHPGSLSTYHLVNSNSLKEFATQRWILKISWVVCATNVAR